MIPTIECLDLSDNHLTGEDLHIVNTNYKKLKVFNLSNNAIRNLDYIAYLGKVASLKTLDLSANPITDINNYRQNLFEKLPNLEALDGYNMEGSECSLGEQDNTRFDNDEFQDNVFCGGFYDLVTNKLRRGGSSQSNDDENDS